MQNLFHGVKFLILLLTLGSPSFGQTRIEKIDSLISSLYQTQKFNGNILIAEKGEIIYQRSFGVENETTKKKLSNQSIFELASCSKQFTAMGIVLLKEKGKLKYDDKVSTYIPELSFYENVSIRNLLHHTGGLPDYLPLLDSLWDKTKIATNKDVIAIFSKYKPKALFSPNSKHEYSNTGYVLLATIIERVSGQSFAAFLKENIFRPLNMKSSFVYNRRLSPKKIKNYALGYLYLSSQKKYVLPDDYEKTKMVYWLDGVVGDGTVNSTVIDLLKWDRALYTDQLVSAESILEIFSNGLLNDGSLGKHGYGWRIMDTKEFGKIAKHSGGWPGYLSYIERNMDHDKTIIILQNHYNAIVPADEIRKILYSQGP